MSQQLVDRFIEALEAVEARRDLEAMTSLFAEDCRVGNVLTPDEYRGTDGARAFWQQYRDTFGDIRSTFRNRIAGDGGAALEWTSEGTSADGRPVRYDGVSILEVQGDRISRFRAYFDPDRLGHQISG